MAAVTALVALATVRLAGGSSEADGTAVVPDPSSPPPAGAVAGSAAGSLSGTVTVGPQLATRRMRFLLYSDFIQPAATPAREEAGSEATNVVVYLKSAAGAAGARPAGFTGAPAVMRQEDLTFRPHVLPVVAGTTVEFPNGDPVFHNVFSLSRAASFDLGRYPRGSSRAVRFDTPGVVKVFCHIHSDMSAVILVLDNPHFARPDAAGRYRIDAIPPGDYTVVAWHERARPLSRRIRIDASAAARLDISIPLAETDSGD
jgi:plastocyanin